jgi:hypothetical protein
LGNTLDNCSHIQNCSVAVPGDETKGTTDGGDAAATSKGRDRVHSLRVPRTRPWLNRIPL